MSFGFAVGDVIAVLGLFERIAIELRTYKDAPAHFQQLSAELDLLRSTFQQVLEMNPATEPEHFTLERIRAIAMHCLYPLQTLADKMRARESSLGHFRSARSLSAIGTRLHWSMIAQKDVDELRKAILSEMVAINMLLGLQQLGRMKQLSAVVKENDNKITTQIDTHANTLTKQISSVLGLLSATPEVVTYLRTFTAA